MCLEIHSYDDENNLIRLLELKLGPRRKVKSFFIKRVINISIMEEGYKHHSHWMSLDGMRLRWSDHLFVSQNVIHPSKAPKSMLFCIIDYVLFKLCRMDLIYAEAPFSPRELLLEKQKLFQSIQKHNHLKGRYDKLTSVIIPLGLALTWSHDCSRDIQYVSRDWEEGMKKILPCLAGKNNGIGWCGRTSCVFLDSS
ncbi:uncharacterized protein LOC113322814 isoform X1 [Papaver somniferum]|uniref:uncharacterized protein LOC113322814 isoform X1 n=1 Tax=Papaver somniferum TaxID=3469 RepID=UPI000E6FE95E|nr:uncharacterized protein LOC113322814 isoform X1 [Papaver somniferum]